MQQVIVHVDMDAFYASVEQRDRPELKGKPVIVGGHPTRGVVLAASYEVRPFGVKSAMPMARAVRAAPQAIVVPPRFNAYVDASEAVFRIFERYTPLIEPLSLDEAFLDVTGSQTLFGNPEGIAREIRQKIKEELELPSSAGIADVKFVAKVASDLAKPNGQLLVPFGQSKEFLRPLPVWRLWGVGPKTEEVLKRHGLNTIGDVAAHDLRWLTTRLGSAGHHLWELSQGIDPRHVVSDRGAKSIGSQDTFEEDLHGEEDLRPHIHGQALRVGRRMRRAGVKARTVQLTVKYADFTQVTRRRTLEQPTDDGQVLYREAFALLSKVDLSRKIRLTGVAGQELTEGEDQLGLFGAAAPARNDKLNAAIDKIASKYGSKAVVTADLAPDEPASSEALRRRNQPGPLEPRDGFYREEKRENAEAAERARALEGPKVVPDD